MRPFRPDAPPGRQGLISSTLGSVSISTSSTASARIIHYACPTDPHFRNLVGEETRNADARQVAAQCAPVRDHEVPPHGGMRCAVAFAGEPGEASPQTVRNAIRKLRRKLGDDARHPGYIVSERGLGYRMPGPEDG